MSFIQLHRIKDNIEAVKAAGQILAGMEPNKEMINSLSDYHGFGGINYLLKDAPPNSKIEAALDDLRILISEQFPNNSAQVQESLEASLLTAFYTPPYIPRAIYKSLYNCGISPKSILDPAAGNGIFLTEAFKELPDIESYTAIEKDILTGNILKAYSTAWPKEGTVLVSGLEQISSEDFQKYDLAATNIPFGSLQIFDPEVDAVYKSRIHLYFFGKTLQLIHEGGLIAFVVTENFLHSKGNEDARKQVLLESDFIALAALPHNLMEEYSGTSVGTHLLLLQKRTGKVLLSEMEEDLVQSIHIQTSTGALYQNKFLHQHPELCIAHEREIGQNLYGQPAEILKFNGHLEKITDPLTEVLSIQIAENYKQRLVRTTPKHLFTNASNELPTLVKLPMPPVPTQKNTVQLGLFDNASEEHNSKALSYVTGKDLDKVARESVSIIGTIQTADDPTHDTIVVLKGRTTTSKLFIYKLVANAEGIKTPKGWITGSALLPALQAVKNRLSEFNHQYRFIGDQTFKDIFQYEHRQSLTNLPHFYKDGTFIFQDGKAGTISDINEEKRTAYFNPLLISEKDRHFLQDYCKVRDAFHLLFDKERNDQQPYPDLRVELVAAYQYFSQSHGQFNLAINRKKILEYDQGLGFISLSAVERRTDHGYTPSDLFERPLLGINHADLTLTDPISALAYTLQHTGKVNIEKIAATCNLSEEECLAALKGKIFFDPDVEAWQTASRYLSGNVARKMQVAREALNRDPNNTYLQDSLAAIEQAQPAPIPFELLDFNLGERWMPTEFLSRFATSYFQTETSVDYFSSSDRFVVQPSAKNANVTELYSVTTKDGTVMHGHILMENALENTTPQFTYKTERHGNIIRIPDTEANLLAEEKISNMRKAFETWIKKIPDSDKELIETLYNSTFNNSVIRKYDGSHLTFPDLDYAGLQIKELRTNQRDGVWRVIEDHGGLMDHDMGSGKTLTAIVASYEMRRMALVKKPLIISIKDAVPAIAETYRRAYPNARLLYPGKDDFTPAKRATIFNSIKHNDWDCIILTHDQFMKIHPPMKIQEQIISEELDNVERDLDVVEKRGGEITLRMKKGLIERKLNLASRLKSIQHEMNEARDPFTFDELGLDYIFVDESHQFKNLMFTTRHSGVAGLGNPTGSQKSMNLLFTIRYLQSLHDKDLCATFLSGTPISNSLTEMFLIFKYLRPRMLERTGMSNFDAWAAVFTKKSVDFEFSVAGNIQPKERFRYFIKLPELCKIYSEITDYKSAEMIGLDRPEPEEMLIEIPPTQDQSTFIENLIAFAKGGPPQLVGLAGLSEKQEKARMLLATNLAQKMSVDMRLISPHYESDPGNKVNTAADLIIRTYNESNAHRGVQLVMCDIGTPSSDVFNVYQDLKNVLVEQGIPAAEITFVHDWPTHQRLSYEKRVNNGEFRVVIGSTSKGGTGINIQERIVAIYNLDIPWRPPDLDQRRTRGSRPGNWVAKLHFGNKIKFYILAVARSLDAYKFNVLKNKAIVIHQARSGQVVERSFDEGAIDENSGMNFAEYVAILSGDNKLLQKAKAEKRIAQLETLRAASLKEAAQARWDSKNMHDSIENCSAVITLLEADLQLFQQNIQFESNQKSRINNIHLDGCSSDPEQVAVYLADLLQNTQSPLGNEYLRKIGMQCGFELYIRVTANRERQLLAKSPLSNITYTYNRGQLEATPNLAMQARHFLFALDSIEENLHRERKSLAHYKEKYKALKSITERGFDHDEEIDQLRRTVQELSAEIAASIEPKARDGPGDDISMQILQNEITPTTSFAEPPPTPLRLPAANTSQTHPRSRVPVSNRFTRGRK